jgi:hypothetical protein
VQKDEHKINAFLQCIGGRIFLQNLDDKTNKHAEMILGQIHIEKVSHSGADLKLSSQAVLPAAQKSLAVMRNPTSVKWHHSKP